MYCSHCGRPMDAAARFCPACGAAVQPAGYVRVPVFGQLMRPRYPRVFGGVCSGLALHYGVTLPRCACCGCCACCSREPGILAYIIAWIVIPEAPYVLPESNTGSGV